MRHRCRRRFFGQSNDVERPGDRLCPHFCLPKEPPDKRLQVRCPAHPTKDNCIWSFRLRQMLWRNRTIARQPGSPGSRGSKLLPWPEGLDWIASSFTSLPLAPKLAMRQQSRKYNFAGRSSSTEPASQPGRTDQPGRRNDFASKIECQTSDSSFSCIQAACLGAFLVFDHSSSMSHFTASSFFNIASSFGSGQASSIRCPLGSKK